MFTTDAHCDTLFETAIKGTAAERVCVTPERLRAGDVGLQTFAMFSALQRRPDPHADGLRMLNAYHALPLRRFDHALPDEPPSEPCAILSIEGGEMLNGRIDALNDFFADAYPRLIALTWNYENQIGMPAAIDATTGLKPFGFALLREMDRRGIAADVSHLNEAGFYDVIERARIAPLASHSCCRWLCDVPRNLYKDQVKALIDRKGFIGVNFYASFLVPDAEATIDDVVRHIDSICALGGEDVVGFGSDFDGIDKSPVGLASPADFPRLIERLRGMGYSEQTLQNIAGLNYWRYLKAAEAKH